MAKGNYLLLLTAGFYALGVIIGTYLLPPTLDSLFLILLLFPLLYGVKGRMRLFLVLLSLLMLLLGLFFTSLRFQAYQSPSSLFRLSGQPLHLLGQVVQIPRETPRGVVFTVQPTRYWEGEEILPISSGLLQVYAREGGISYGDTVEIKGMVNRPSGMKNPGGFSYRHYLYRQGIAGTIFLEEGQKDLRVERGRAGFFSLAQRIKEWIGKRLEMGFEAPYSALVRALFLGERELLPSGVDTLFRETGLGHLLAVSGLHVGMISLFLWRFFAFLGWKEKPTALFMIFTIAFYMVICGLRPSIVRASLVVIFYSLSRILGKEIDLLDITGLSALILLLFQPFLLFDVGFQLSYLVYLSVLFFTPILSPWVTRLLPGKLGLSISLSLAAQLGAWPVVAYYFHEFSLWPVAANLVAIPLLTLILSLLIPALLVSIISPFLFFLFTFLIGLLLKTLLLILEFLASVPVFLIRTGELGLPFLFLYFVLLSLLLIFLTGKKKGGLAGWEKSAVVILCILALLNLFFFMAEGEEGVLRAYFLDVGQGLAVFFVLPGGETLFYDGGGLYSFHDPQYNRVAEEVILPLLTYKGIQKVDGLVISHYHMDHVLGFLPLIEEGRTSFLVSPWRGEDFFYNELFLQVEEMVRKNQIPFFFLEEGDHFRFGEVFFRVLAPPKTLLTQTHCDENNNSLVIRVEYRQQKILLTGDIEKEMEAHLLQHSSISPFLWAQTLQVGHHGSNTSSTAPFLEAVQPQVAVISSAPSYFGHPSPLVLDRLEEVECTVYRTDELGAIVMETDGEELTVYPYWQDRSNFRWVDSEGSHRWSMLF